jgi:hypothetical protein
MILVAKPVSRHVASTERKGVGGAELDAGGVWGLAAD